MRVGPESIPPLGRREYRFHSNRFTLKLAQHPAREIRTENDLLQAGQRSPEGDWLLPGWIVGRLTLTWQGLKLEEVLLHLPGNPYREAVGASGPGAHAI